MKVTSALLSVSDKSKIVEFAEALIQRNIQIISTGGTANILMAQGLSVTPISDVTGFPEILDGRVKTLHPAIHAAILADVQNKQHAKQLEELTINPLQLVVANLYPFEATVRDDRENLAACIENIDIGGPAMIRAAAKNFKNTCVVTSPDQYDLVIKYLEDNNGEIPLEIRMNFAKKAFELTSYYDNCINHYFRTITPRDDVLPETLLMNGRIVDHLRYGENPHQSAAIYTSPLISESAFVNAKKLGGKELSFNNYLDLYSAFTMSNFFEDPTAVIVKHQNPCGIGSSKTIHEAYKKALGSDPMSAYGGIASFNRSIDRQLAIQLSQTTFLEVISAPAIENDALEILKKKKNRRIMVIPSSINQNLSNYDLDYRYLDGGVLVQNTDLNRDNIDVFQVVTEKQPTSEEKLDLVFAWNAVRFVKSNAVLMAKDRQTVGIGAGQVSRVDSVFMAVHKAGERAIGSVMASDAFFPFRDGIDLAAKAGVQAIIQPGGSKRDEEVISACNELGISMIFTGIRHFKH